MSCQFIEVTVENNIATLALNRVDSLNALTIAFGEEMTAAVKDLSAREDARVIVLKSNARIFCSGLDLKAFMKLGLLGGGAKKSFHFYDSVRPLFDCCNVLEECRKPVIAAVHGLCVGGGLDIISACDIRLCTEDASFSLREAAVGFVADMGVLQRLPHIIGQGFAREMAFTARFYTAREVERMGLVNAVYPDQTALMDAAYKLARQIADNAPLAVMGTKEVLNYSRTATIPDGMAKAIEKNAMFLTSKDIKEAATAFAEKRKPNFTGE